VLKKGSRAESPAEPGSGAGCITEERSSNEKSPLRKVSKEGQVEDEIEMRMGSEEK
jgi:hypothetical protein